MLSTAHQRENLPVEYASTLKICNTQQKYKEQQNGQGVDTHDVVSTSAFLYSLNKEKKNCLLLSMPRRTSSAFLVTRDDGTEHLFVTGGRLHHWFYLWERQN